MIDKKSIQREIKKGLKNKTITTEAQAEEVANKYISSDEPSYEVTLQISDMLPKKVHTVLSSEEYKHPWFKGKMQTIVYVDTFGRMWSKSKGVVKKDIKIGRVNKHYYIKSLGGMMWQSKKGRTFICQYRTTEEEINLRPSPETFVG